MRKSIKVSIYIAVILLFSKLLFAAPLFNIPLTLKQPDGTILHVYQSGDEFYNWVHDKPYTDPQNWRRARENYTILQNQSTGYYVYAVIEKGKLVPSQYAIGSVDPASVGIEKGLNVVPDISKPLALARANYNAGYSAKAVVDARYNLVILVRFSDDVEFDNPRSDFDNVFNDAAGPSVKHYYNETSNGRLNVSSTIYPLGANIASYPDTHARAYYQPKSYSNSDGYSNDSEKSSRETVLLKAALDYVRTSVPTGALLDGNGDGAIDNVIFIIKGDSGAWDDLLWSHMSTISWDETINGKSVSRYNLIMQNQFDCYTLMHEIGHTLGMPDLYRYNNDETPIGIWDLMAYNQAHMSNYMKWRYLGWISSIPEITASGTYWLKKSSSASGNVVYKIKSPKSPVEYFVVEYRYQQGYYENRLPGSGLVVYRVNPGMEGNAYGPPDEIYIYRPGGTTTDDGYISQAFFNGNIGRTQINDATDPSPFLSTGGAGGLSIKNIGSLSADSIRFDVDITGTYTNSYKAEQTGFTWQDISTTGTTIKNWINGNSTDPDSCKDDGYTGSAIPLGINFSFYGHTYNSIYVGINGLVSFTYQYLNIGNEDAQGAGIYGYFSDSAAWPGNKYFPSSIAVAYNDLDLNKNDGYGGGRVLYKTINDKFYLTWLNVGTFNNPGDTTNTFQLVLDASDNSATINFKKLGLAATRSSAKIGMQESLVDGLGWVNAGDVTSRIPQDETSVRFSLNTTPTGINERTDYLPVEYALMQNYPNPFNPSTKISYTLKTASKVVVKVFDMLGREVQTIVDAFQDAGSHNCRFDARNMASGVYIYQLNAYPAAGGNTFTQARKMMVLK
jgi:M6 family metalloprotease-like protein